jgi:hypothetical protein
LNSIFLQIRIPAMQQDLKTIRPHLVTVSVQLY